ncbi:MAG: N-acetylmuramoyl-L-alanine amidase [Spirochaetes bacterium]|nr:N-acetylmuramoyl-L-alanine amidase [Spirochaetota bacterium]
MRLKAIVFSSAVLAIFIFYLPLFSLNATSSLHQDSIIASIIDNENNITNLNKIKDILAQIDEVYGGLYNKLNSGGKIIVFFDPAHGRLNNGKWEGEVTGRLSSTGFPEEYYSIQFARKLYRLLLSNKYIKVVSNDEYMRVLKGESNEYRRISFSETVRFAKSEKAFIILSEHLNNVSSLLKTDGMINMPGIHVTCDEAGNRYLTYISSSHEGYLTLYNKYDLSGLSKSIAYKLKEYIPLKGIRLNNWDYGAVADDRFSIFTDFPISVIFECGFISNPAEEVRLRDPEYQQKIVDTQYAAILKSIEKIFGVDISGFWLKKTNDNAEIIDLIKLSRISIYYLRKCFPEKAVNIINEIEKNYYKSYSDLIDPYIILKERIIKAENHFKKCVSLYKVNKNKEAKRNLIKAVKATGNEPIFTNLLDKYSNYANNNFKLKNITSQRKEKPEKILLHFKAGKANLNTPIILPVEKNQALEEALMMALSPGPETFAKLIKSFDEAYITKRIKKERYSEKRKRKIVYWEKEKIKINFKEGLFIVNLNNNLRVIKAKKVSQVLLDPGKYQNNQYLKNSYFAGNKKEKSL